MDTRLMVLVVIAVVAVILVVTLLLLRERTSERLKQHFGPEYDRTVGTRSTTRRSSSG